MPRFFAIVVTSRRHARDTALSAISGNDINAALLICARASSRIPGTVEGGVAMTARSIGLPIAASVACAGRPKSRRWFGLTAKIVAVELPGEQVLEDGAAERARAFRRADERDGLRRQQRREIVMHA